MKIKSDDEFWQEHLGGKGRFFVQNQWNIYQLDSFAQEHPNAPVVFTYGLHDQLPVFFERFKNPVILPTKTHHKIAQAFTADPSRLSVFEWDERRDHAGHRPLRKMKKLLLLNDEHPYGSIAANTSLAVEILALYPDIEVYEFWQAMRELAVPLKRSGPHQFPPHPLDLIADWKRKLRAKTATIEFDSEDTLIVWLPLHLGPPVSMNFFRFAKAGFSVLHMSGLWDAEVRAPFNNPLANWDEFDPFFVEETSSVNRSCALRLLRQLHEQGLFQ